jgi:hypothetical protein
MFNRRYHSAWLGKAGQKQMKFTIIRIKATGQVTEMVPDVARAMILGGMAEEVKTTESMAVGNQAEHAVAPAQSGPFKKTRKTA